MGILDFLKGADINQGVEEWKRTANGILIDVRTAEEYRQGHIPGGMNIPLDRITAITDKITDKNTPLFVHCLSGARSRQAVQIIKHVGYNNVKNIGGISTYRGKVVRY